MCSTRVLTVGTEREEGEGCLGAVQPDTLVYTDEEGVEHIVHIPNGTFEQAVEFANVQDWDGLAKFLG